MNDEIHSCSYYCDRPACIKAQRDELVRKYVEVPTAERVRVPDGMVLVPAEPTGEMSQAAYEAAGCPSDWFGFDEMWAAALSTFRHAPTKD